MSFNSIDKEQKIIKAFPPEVQSALTADMMAGIAELFKAIGLDAVRQTSLADLYQKLLQPEPD